MLWIYNCGEQCWAAPPNPNRNRDNVEACFDNAITWLNHTKWTTRAKYEFRKDRLDLVGGVFSDSVSTCFCSDGRKKFISNIFKYYTKLALAWLHFLQAYFTPGTLECSIKVTKKLTDVRACFLAQVCEHHNVTTQQENRGRYKSQAGSTRIAHLSLT